ncbi:hypothetical protein BC628DRAFT_302606 [Trametes gibbosa]|nr:hypothetical protein BC628DRAFT_302606 [Trametes gibbosa]
MRRLTFLIFSSLLPTFSGLFTSRLFCCCCIVHPHKRTKTHGKPQKTLHIASSLQSFPADPLALALRGFFHELRVPVSPRVVGWPVGARLLPLPCPRTPCNPLDEATLLSFPARSPPLVATLRPIHPVGIRSLCDIDSLVSPTAHAARLTACFVHVNRSETVML